MGPEFIDHRANTLEKVLEAIAKKRSPEIDVTMCIPRRKLVVQHNGLAGVVFGIGEKPQDLIRLAQFPFIDVQHPLLTFSYVSLLSEAIGDHPVIVCGTKHQVVSVLCAIRPDRRLPLYSIGKPKHLEEYSKHQDSLMQPFGFSVRLDLINPELLKELRNRNRNGIKIYAWTIKNLRQAEELAEMGVDGFIADNSQELQEALSKP